MATRAAYIAGLKREHAYHSKHGNAAKLEGIEAELSRFSETPSSPEIEIAAKPGPISRARA